MSIHRPGRGPSAVHDALVHSLEVADRASAEALLWFAEVQGRHLYRVRGHLSIHHYAEAELGFGTRKAEQFVQLSRLVLRYRRLRASLVRGRLTWTQVRTIASALTPESEAHWVARAEAVSRRELAREIAAARARARERVTTPDQVRLPEPRPAGPVRGSGGTSAPESGSAPGTRSMGPMLPPTSPTSPTSPTLPTPPTSPTLPTLPTLPTPTSPPHAPTRQAAHPTPLQPSRSQRPGVPGVPASSEVLVPAADPGPGEDVEVMTTLAVRLRPVERARLERALEALRKQGHRGDRGALILAAVEAMVSGTGVDEDPSSPSRSPASGSEEPAPGEPASSKGIPSRSRHQVVVSVCPTCRQAHTGAGRHQHAVDPVTVETLLCDADVVDEHGHRRATIPPAVRRRVLAPNGHRCAAPGCGSTHHLEIHHRVPASRGGTNEAGNLVTLCHACHRSLHEIARRRGPSSLPGGPDGVAPAPGCGCPERGPDRAGHECPAPERGAGAPWTAKRVSVRGRT